MNDYKDCGPNDSYSDGGLPNHPQPVDDVKVYGGARGGKKSTVFRAGPVTLRIRITELCLQYGGLEAAASALRIHPGYLSKLKREEHTAVPEGILRRMGLGKALVTYERLLPRSGKIPRDYAGALISPPIC